jgi:hypothetical protein
MPRNGSPYGPAYERARKRLLGRPCALRLVCDGAPATSADHVPPLSRHRHVEGSGCCHLQPACTPCQNRQLADLTNETRRGRATVADDLTEWVEPEGIPAGDPIWRVPWLVDLLELPDDAVWPRFMSVPHPAAVGSLGPEFEEWCRARRGLSLRWWQRLVVRRLLEVDADGVLVWDTMILTLARQLGKTWLFRELLFWRIHQGPRFGGQQPGLHMARDLRAARKEFMKVARQLVDQRDRYGVIVTKTQEEIRLLEDDSAWIVRTIEGAYGETAGLAVVDESWDVEEHQVDEGIDPTRVSVPQSQLLLTSTAHRRAKFLMLRRRYVALLAIAERTVDDDGDLLVEWSMPRHFDLEDVEGWRMASPHWSAQRERLMRKNVRRALSGGSSNDPDEVDPIESFRGQWLNQWPPMMMSQGKGEPLLNAARWADLPTAGNPPRRVWVAVADNFGRGAAVAAVAELGDGMFEVDGWTCEDRDAALAAARGTLDALGVPGRIVVEPALSSGAPRADRATPADVRFGLPLLRELVESGRLVHDATPELDQQIGECRVRPVQGGLALATTVRSDLVRATALAVRAAVVYRPVPAVHGAA